MAMGRMALSKQLLSLCEDSHNDNNSIEREMRPVALGRKNYMFAGSHDAAQRGAMIYSLFATCRLHKINPYNWLKDVLIRMPNYTTKKLHELLPQNWTPADHEQ